MSARTFRAVNLVSALRAVRAELGDSAVIMSTVESAQGVEVKAMTATSRRGMRRMLERLQAQRDRAEQEAEEEALPVAAGGGGHVVLASPSEPLPEDDLELPEPVEDSYVPAATRAGLDGAPGLQVVRDAPPRKTPIAAALRDMDLPPDLAARLTKVAGRGPLGWERILAFLERGWPSPDVHLGRVGRPVALAFVGPDGVGRSTLIRGLASRAVIDEPGRVVMVQIGFPGRRLDPRSELDAPVGVELRRAHHPSELRHIVLDHSDVSAVLLDLPAIDVHNPGEREALQRFVQAAERSCPEVEWHAVLSARWSTREATRTLRALDFVPLQGAAWTFLDRVADPGTVIATTLRTDLAPSFLHGDGNGDGESSGAATWDSIVDWLRTETGRSATDG